MLIDIIFAILLVLAVVRGYQRGLIVGVFSLVAIVIGLAAALKLSAAVAGWIGRSVNVSTQWLPILSFALVFLGVILLVRLGANAIEKTVEVAMMGWVNRLGGILFYLAIYVIVFSVVLFYAEQVKVLSPEAIHSSVSYSYVQPWGPRAIEGFGKVVPVFKDMFAQLEDFFGKLSHQVALQ